MRPLTPSQLLCLSHLPVMTAGDPGFDDLIEASEQLAIDGLVDRTDFVDEEGWNVHRYQVNQRGALAKRAHAAWLSFIACYGGTL